MDQSMDQSMDSDIRNTKVVDIIKELKEYGANIDVYEPWIDEKDKDYYDYNFVSNPLENDKKYEAIIVAVGHDKFKEITQDQYESIICGEILITDVKGIVPEPSWKL